MARRFVPFDDDAIQKELDTLPDRDKAKLLAVAEIYEASAGGSPLPAQVDGYGDGLVRLRHTKASYQGRLIFFVHKGEAGEEHLVIVSIYKKEGQKTPSSVLERARRRMKAWIGARGGK